MGTPLVSGREFTDPDGADAPRVAIVSESMARSFYGSSTRRPAFGFHRAKPHRRRDRRRREGRQGQTCCAEIARVVYTPYPQDEGLGEMTSSCAGPGPLSTEALAGSSAGGPGDARVDVKSMGPRRTSRSSSTGWSPSSRGASERWRRCWRRWGFTVSSATRSRGARRRLACAWRSAPLGRVVGLVMREVTILVGDRPRPRAAAGDRLQPRRPRRSSSRSRPRTRPRSSRPA